VGRGDAMTHAPELRIRMVHLTGLAWLIAVSATIVPLLDARPALAQDLGNPKYQFQPRKGPDRAEGLKPLERSGAYVDLAGAFLHVAEPRAASAPGDRWRLGFFLPRQEKAVEIQVRDYDRFQKDKYRYWMIPARTDFPAGFREFAWDGSLARELGLGLGDLGAVVRLGGHGYPTVAPLLLQAPPFPRRLQAEGVRFVFVPSETMTVEYAVHPLGAPSQALWGNAGARWEKDARISVHWPGRDRQGKPVGEGVYVLALTAKVTTLQGFVETIPLDHTFHYRPEIMTE
jgi:hypothetical protein